jgi:hypothetical protein
MSHIMDIRDQLIPCDFLFGKGTQEQVSFRAPHKDKLGFDLSQYINSFGAQQSFVISHVKKGILVPTDVAAPFACPYHTSCDHPLKNENEDYCRRSPWMHIHSATTGCWYTNGVNATLGHVRLTRQDDSSRESNLASSRSSDT